MAFCPAALLQEQSLAVLILPGFCRACRVPAAVCTALGMYSMGWEHVCTTVWFSFRLHHSLKVCVPASIAALFHVPSARCSGLFPAPQEGSEYGVKFQPFWQQLSVDAQNGAFWFAAGVWLV